MQAVILAAGKSTRTCPLTITKPKPLLKVANKTLLEHNLDNLSGIVDEAVLVVGYKKEMIKEHFKNKYKNIKIKYVWQKQQLGTANALSVAESHVKSEFILMAGDDIYSGSDMQKCIKHKYSILTAKVKNPRDFGVIVEKNGILADIVEKPQKFISDLISTSFYVLDNQIFDCLKILKKSERNELEMPDAIRLLSKNNKIHCVKSRQWLPVGYPWDLLRADIALRKNKTFVGNNSKIYGKVKNSSIGDNCIIKGIVEDSIVMDNSTIGSKSAVKDSVIGENVCFNGKINSGKNATSMVNNKKIKINGRFGAVIADNVIADNVMINPGCKIWPGRSISNKTVNEDVA